MATKEDETTRNKALRFALSTYLNGESTHER
jgi:hypothetical protein